LRLGIFVNEVIAWIYAIRGSIKAHQNLDLAQFLTQSNQQQLTGHELRFTWISLLKFHENSYATTTNEPVSIAGLRIGVGGI